jgi:DNA-binding MurR/RpiR family transcriptional regulator
MRHYHVFTKQEKTVENSSLIQHMHKYHENIIHQTGEFIPSSKVEQFVNNLKISRQINYTELGRSDLSASEFYYKTMQG